MPAYQINSKDNVNWVEITLNNETVRAEMGALRFMQGPIQMESKAPSIGGIFKAAVTGESIFRPTYTGSGRLVLEPSLRGFLELDLDNETLVLDQGAYWCSDGSVEVSAMANKAATAILGGQGLFQTTVKGTGKVIASIPGPVEVIDLVNDKLVVDGPLAVARAASLDYKVERSTRSIFGSVTSGEGLVNVFQGTGRVWLCPIPYLHVMMYDAIVASADSTSS